MINMRRKKVFNCLIKENLSKNGGIDEYVQELQKPYFYNDLYGGFIARFCDRDSSSVLDDYAAL